MTAQPEKVTPVMLASPVSEAPDSSPTFRPTESRARSNQVKTNWFQRAKHVIGFTRTYNLILWFILGEALFGFTLARFQYLNFSVFCPADGSGGASGASPGECYWFQFSRYKIGIILHLATILPASLLVVVQFTPFIRKRFRTFHRITGYTAVALGVVSMAGVLMIADRSFGGAPSTQGFVGALTIAFLAALGLAVYNIRKKQIEQHRAWMIRAWVWAGSTITLRIIMIIAVQIISMYPDDQSVFVAYSCNVVRYILRNDTRLVERYPTCEPVVTGTNMLGEALQVAVQGSFDTSGGRPERIGAGLSACFPMAGWLAFGLHIIGTEVYLKLTPAESERLRRISYEKQMEKGLKNPGNAGLTVERLGDAKKWQYEQA